MRGFVEFMENQEREGLGTEHKDWLEHNRDSADSAHDRVQAAINRNKAKLRENHDG